MTWWICTRHLLMIQRGVCPACQLLMKKTTMDYCLLQHAALVSIRTSTSLSQKRSVPTNRVMRASTTLATTLFSCQRCIIVDTTIRNPTIFFTSAIILCPNKWHWCPTTPMIHYESTRKANKLRIFGRVYIDRIERWSHWELGYTPQLHQLSSMQKLHR